MESSKPTLLMCIYHLQVQSHWVNPKMCEYVPWFLTLVHSLPTKFFICLNLDWWLRVIWCIGGFNSNVDGALCPSNEFSDPNFLYKVYQNKKQAYNVYLLLSKSTSWTKLCMLMLVLWRRAFHFAQLKNSRSMAFHWLSFHRLNIWVEYEFVKRFWPLDFQFVRDKVMIMAWLCY